MCSGLIELDAFERRANESYSVPSGYFKIIYDNSGATGFVMQQSSGRKDDYCLKRFPISDIQVLVNYQIPNFNNSKETLIIVKSLIKGWGVLLWLNNIDH